MKHYKLPAPTTRCELTRRVKIKRSTKTPATIHLNEEACLQFLGATIGTLAGMADIDTLRKAVKWWADTEKAWLPFKRLRATRDSKHGTNVDRGRAVRV